MNGARLVRALRRTTIGRALGGLLAVTAIVGGALVQIGVSVGIVVAPAIVILVTVVVAADQLFSRVRLTGGEDHQRADALAAIDEATIWPPPRVLDLDPFRFGVLRSGIAERSLTSRWSKTSRPVLRRGKWARARHRSAHTSGPQRAKPRGRLKAPDVCASLRQSSAPTQNLTGHDHADKPEPSRV
jgi:hypothetical protein